MAKTGSGSGSGSGSRAYVLPASLSLSLFVGTLGPITGQKVKPIEGDPGQFAWCTVRNWLVNQIGCYRNTFHNCQAFQHPLSNCQSSGWAPLQWRDSRNRCSRSARFTTQSQAQLRVSHSLGPHIHSTHSLIRSFTHSFYSSRERFKVRRLILIHNQWVLPWGCSRSLGNSPI